MAQPRLDVSTAGRVPVGAGEWLALADCAQRVPPVLLPWLSEPGLLTARVRAACGPAARLRLMRLEPAPLGDEPARRLGVEDTSCLLREIEFTCGVRRWIFAQSVLPQSTVERHPWLRELGDQGLGEAMGAVADVRREPLEYLELYTGHPLALAATADPAAGGLWARRAIYRLAGWPILVQEVFLPALGRCD